MIRRSLLRFARGPAGGRLLRFALRHIAAILPVRKVCFSKHLIAFHHPVPVYPTHILIVPLPPLDGLDAVDPDDTALLAGVLRTAHEIAGRLDLPPGRRLVVNGGRFQEVGVLHFHLISSEK